MKNLTQAQKKVNAKLQDSLSASAVGEREEQKHFSAATTIADCVLALVSQSVSQTSQQTLFAFSLHV